MEQEKVNPVHENYLTNFALRNAALAKAMEHHALISQNVSEIISEQSQTAAFEKIAAACLNIIEMGKAFREAAEHHKNSLEVK